jgi:hypothetical protein
MTQVLVNPAQQANAKPVPVQAKTAQDGRSAGNGTPVSRTENVQKTNWLQAVWSTYIRQHTLDRVGFPVSGLFLAVAIAVLYLSLDHLTWAIHEITARKGGDTSSMQARLMAVAIDVGLILSEIKLVIDFHKRGKGSKESWLTVLLTSVMSAGMNAWAFAYEVMLANPDLAPFAFGDLGGAGQAAPFFKFYACVGFGIFVPVATFLFLKQATQLWLGDKGGETTAESQGSKVNSGNSGNDKGHGNPKHVQGGKK